MPIKTTRRDPRVLRRVSRPGAAPHDEVLAILRAVAKSGGTESSISIARDRQAFPRMLDWRVQALTDVEFTRSDLAGSRIAPRFLRPAVRLTDCRFRDVDLQQSNVSRTECQRCTFHHVRFADSQFNNVAIADSAFTASDFRGAKFRRSAMRSVRFGGCRFDRTSFLRSDLADVKVVTGSGFLAFHHTTLTAVDFSGASLGEMTFGHCVLRDVTFPASGDWIALRMPDFARVVREILAELTPKGRDYLGFWGDEAHMRGIDPWIVGPDLMRPMALTDRQALMAAASPFALRTYSRESSGPRSSGPRWASLSECSSS
jgi:hypothetical protein